MLLAPGILANPVPVEAMYDPHAARETVMRNVLSQAGYSSLEAVLAEGESLGRAEGEAVGLAKGEAAGIAKGETQGTIAALLEVYRARFGNPPSNLAEIFARQDAATLRPLFSVLVTESLEKVSLVLGGL